MINFIWLVVGNFFRVIMKESDNKKIVLNLWYYYNVDINLCN